MASPDNTDANDLFMWLGGLIDDFAEARDLGNVYGSRVAFKLSEVEAPEPDIGFVRTSRLNLVRRGQVAGPPDLALEIVSPESIERDYGKKKLQYEQARVEEYWIVDEMKKKVTVFRLDDKGKYHKVAARRGVLYSEVLPGFWLRPKWLW